MSYPPEFLASTRTAYDTVAESYADLLRNELTNKPNDRAMLGAFADLVRDTSPATVVDAGCGPAGSPHTSTPWGSMSSASTCPLP